MANARIGGYVFNINPSEAQWGYTLNTSSQDTYGGRVIQVLSCKIDSLQIKGYLTQKGTAENQWANMEQFEKDIKSIMDWHAKNKKPVKFSFPALGWNGDVYVTGYSNVQYDMKTAAVSYTLSMTVDSGFETIKEHASSEGLDLIPDGVGWTRNKFNTPKTDDWNTAKEALKKVLENAGTYDADNPPDIYKYMEEISNKEMEAEGGSTDLVGTESSTETPSGGYIGLILEKAKKKIEESS